MSSPLFFISTSLISGLYETIMFACEVDVAVAIGVVLPSVVTMAGFWMLLESVEIMEFAGIIPSSVATTARL